MECSQRWEGGRRVGPLPPCCVPQAGAVVSAFSQVSAPARGLSVHPILTHISSHGTSPLCTFPSWFPEPAHTFTRVPLLSSPPGPCGTPFRRSLFPARPWLL